MNPHDVFSDFDHLLQDAQEAVGLPSLAVKLATSDPNNPQTCLRLMRVYHHIESQEGIGRARDVALMAADNATGNRIAIKKIWMAMLDVPAPQLPGVFAHAKHAFETASRPDMREAAASVMLASLPALQQNHAEVRDSLRLVMNYARAGGNAALMQSAQECSSRLSAPLEISSRHIA